MLLRRVSEHVRAQNWFAVLVDFLVVVIGLFIGLQVDTWWENRKEQALEQLYLVELLEDFNGNDAKLSEARAGLERIIEAMVELQGQAALESPDLDVQALNERFALIQSMPSFLAVKRAYSNLTGSGDLRLIENRDLKNSLAQYYAQVEEILLVMQTHEAELVETFQPYIIENLDYAAVAYERVDDYKLPAPIDGSLIVELLPTREFRNVTTQKYVIATDLLNIYRDQHARNAEILDRLKDEID
jgi:hypothetical protein